MQVIEPPRRVNYKGLAVQYLEGQHSMPAVVIAKGLGIPSKETGWMFLMNKLGFNVIYAPYRGTWLSEGKFLPNSNGELSVTKDISDLVDFSFELFGPREVYIVGDCFGASPALVSAAKHDEVSKVFTYGGMIYIADADLNRKYKKNGDKSLKLGLELDKSMREGGELFDGYQGFNLAVWRKMINGRTSLNPYNFLEHLARKRIMAMHPREDRMIHYERSIDFVKALDAYCDEKGLDRVSALRIVESVGHDRKGHKTGFGPEQKIEVIELFTGEKSDTLMPKLMEAAAFEETYEGRIKKEDGSVLRIPFYELVVHQIEEFKRAKLLKNKPLDMILREIITAET